MITEGKVKLDIELPDKVSKKLDVFYNPLMELNRSSSIELLKIHCKTNPPVRVALPLSGSGIRGVRFLKEISECLTSIDFNDMSEKAVARIKYNLELNNVEFDEIKIHEKEAPQFLFESKGFDYIDVDPFGTPNPFLDAACQRVSRGGLLAITATDTAPLSGSYPKVCLRHYDAKPVRNELKHVVGLRILIRKIQMVAAQYDKALYPIFSYSKDHYFRVVLRCVKSKMKSTDIIKAHKYLLYCNKCLERKSSDFNTGTCDCGETYDYAGPLYAGPLWEKPYDEMDLIKEIPLEATFEGKYFSVHEICSVLKAKHVPSFDSIFDRLTDLDFQCSRTHFSHEMIKTNCPLSKLKEEIIYLVSKS